MLERPSPGAPADKEKLTAGEFWRAVLQDGRRSVAMMALLEQARLLVKQGLPLRVLAYDTGGDNRDETMAQALATAFRTEPKSTFVVLSGNLHARKTSGSFGRTFMVQALLEQGLAVTALSYRSGEGSAWFCTGFSEDTCGPGPIGKGAGLPLAVKLENAEAGAYDGWLDVGACTWSPPAAVKLSAAQKHNVESFTTRRTAIKAYDEKKYAECAAAFMKLTSADDVYSTACCQALGGRKDAAFASLQKLKKLGFSDAAASSRTRTSPHCAAMGAGLR